MAVMKLKKGKPGEITILVDMAGRAVGMVDRAVIPVLPPEGREQ
jgi:hypothetical protein